jgi:hypothetical protein
MIVSSETKSEMTAYGFASPSSAARFLSAGHLGRSTAVGLVYDVAANARMHVSDVNLTNG